MFESIAIASLMIGTAALLIACLAFIEIKSSMKSTHKIQWMPAPTPGVKRDKEGFEELDDQTRMKLEQDDLYFDDPHKYDDGTVESLRPDYLKNKAEKV